MRRQFDGDRLLIATHNAGKLDEMRQMFAPLGVEIVGAAEMGLGEPEETEDNFVGNARIKARAAVEATGLPALADDSGIEVEALDGAPGVYTADWAETPSGRDFKMAMAKTWQKLEEVDAPFPRRARFCCTLMLAWPDGHEEVYEGYSNGQITWPMRGEHGHGYDPIFQPDGHDISFGQMDPDEKNRISHRARAFQALIEGSFAR